MGFESNTYMNTVDRNLIELILKGNKDALNSLIKNHKDWIFNIAIGMTGNVYEAEDVTQEIIIKIITKLSTFKFNSSFRTWIYRITFNHVLTMKRMGKEKVFSSFEEHSNILDKLSDKDPEDNYPVGIKLLVEETKIDCMSGMLLCLNREQRLVFIVGGIFGVNSKNGASLLDLSEVNFRKRLSRARSDLKSFMDNNCSLLNKKNSCKCVRKTRSAIEKGYINPEKLQFADVHLKKVKEMVDDSDITVNDLIDLRYDNVFKENPFQIFNSKEFDKLMRNLDFEITYQ